MPFCTHTLIQKSPLRTYIIQFFIYVTIYFVSSLVDIHSYTPSIYCHHRHHCERFSLSWRQLRQSTKNSHSMLCVVQQKQQKHSVTIISNVIRSTSPSKEAKVGGQSCIYSRILFEGFGHIKDNKLYLHLKVQR